ncbi:MAG: hypothetical protein ACJ749_03215 [Flavisolibacter sp.]
MIKAALLLVLISYGTAGQSQGRQILLMKKDKVLQRFWLNSRITFSVEKGQWQYGIITKINSDSFSFTKESIFRHFGGTDTTHVSGYVFLLSDIKALPSKRQITVVNGDDVKLIYGHEKFVWIRNGFVFQAAGVGYAAVNITNSLLDKTHSAENNNLQKLGIAAGLFLVGQVLHWTFDPTIKIKKKVHLEVSEY